MPCRLCRENARAAGATFGCLAIGAIHAHRFSPVIYNETLCRYTSRNFPSFSRETTSETESAMKIGAYGLPSDCGATCGKSGSRCTRLLLQSGRA